MVTFGRPAQNRTLTETFGEGDVSVLSAEQLAAGIEGDMRHPDVTSNALDGGIPELLGRELHAAETVAITKFVRMNEDVPGQPLPLTRPVKFGLR